VKREPDRALFLLRMRAAWTGSPGFP
jgi:hypothetical protein